MPIAVTLRVDDPPLLALHDEAAIFGSVPSFRQRGYGLPITLAVYEDLPTKVVRAPAARLFEGSIAIELLFEAVRWFEGPLLTLYAAPTPSPKLDAIFDRLHRLIAPERCRPHYRPGSFVPHCTLATGIKVKGREEALAFALSLRADFARGDVVTFPPPRIEASWRLPSAAVRGHG
ncbi:MAG: hypothetical protein JO172_00830 [Hyphomicrobiales bacterium]|nr:hypothetical protein [Hyphomicrobiales bacterium]